jgi:hypothetical protein
MCHAMEQGKKKAVPGMGAAINSDLQSASGCGRRGVYCLIMRWTVVVPVRCWMRSS